MARRGPGPSPLWCLLSLVVALPQEMMGAGAPACGRFVQRVDCDGNDIGHVTNSTAVLTPSECCRVCATEPGCKVAVLVSPWQGGNARCLMKSGCSTPTPLDDRVLICPADSGDPACTPPAPPPGTPCPCASCPCDRQKVLPRTCDAGSVAAGMPFCNASLPTSERVADLLGRLSRTEQLYLVDKADTGFLPRLNLKEFKFFNTCVHGWWTSNVSTFGMPIGMAAMFDLELMRRVAEVVGVESRALSQRDYNQSYDWDTGLHGVSLNWLVCKDSSEVNMARHPLWGRISETYGTDSTPLCPPTQ